MKKNSLLLLLMSFLWLFQLQAGPASSEVKTNSENARKVRCLTVSNTQHFEVVYPRSLRSIMEAFGGVEYIYTSDVKSLTVAKMLEYDVVWVYNFADWLSTSGVWGYEVSDTLAKFVKAGGHLVEGMYLQSMDYISQAGLLGGAYISEQLSPFKSTDILAAGSSNMGVVTHPEHPIMDGVKAINVTTSVYVTEAQKNATTLAYYDEIGAPLVSVFDNIVAVNIPPLDLNLTMGVGTYVYGDGYRLFHNAIKWLFANKYDLTAPNGVADLRANPAPAEGTQFNITLEWLNPSTLINGDPLANFTALRIYRDETLIKTIDAPTIGVKLSWVDENVPFGVHTYKLIAMDGTKEGYPISVKTFSGRDVPAPAKNVNLAPKGNAGHLTWETSTYGANNGWIDAATFKYKIVRKPDNITVAEAHTTTTFTDNTITQKKKYYYEITPSTIDGAGAMTKSEPMYLYTNGDVYMGTANVVTCGGKFYSPEGPDSNYILNTMYALTLIPENAGVGERMQVSFKKFDLDFKAGSLDQLYIYDGPDMQSMQIAGSPFSGEQVPTALEKIQASAGNTSGALTFGFISDIMGVGKGWEADIACVQLSNVDMAAESIIGEDLPIADQSYTYQTIVRNNGLEAQSDFTVKFFENTPDNVISSVELKKSIVPGDTLHIPFVWTPNKAEKTTIGIFIELANDANTTNQSKNLTLQVQSSTTAVNRIGDSKIFSTMFMPLCFFYNTSVTQSIYRPNEINLAKGEITALRYYNTFQNEVRNERVILHMAETTKKDLASGWFPIAQMKKVYDGIMTFPYGDNGITIVLDSIFDYKGGNIVMRVEHPNSKYTYTIGDAFYVNFDNENNFRSLRYGSATTAFDEKTAPVEAADYVAQILFAMDVKDAAKIKGVVTSKGLPVDSVRISVKGTPYTAMTNAKGEYSFPSLNADTCILQCVKYSYVTKEVENIIITNRNTTIQNIEINEIPRAVVSGKVVDNEGVLIEGASVELNGYDNYKGMTKDDGTFSIARVYTEQEYEIIVKKDRFTTYKGIFGFASNDTTLGAITLTQIAYPPLYVKAEKIEAENTLQITWKDPSEMNFNRIIYDNGEATTSYGVRPDGDGWFGTVFGVSDSGILESIDIFGVQHGGLAPGEVGKRYLTLDIFDAHRKKIASSEPFLMPAEDWINIPLNFLPYKGTFYAMVHFPVSTTPDNWNNMIGGDLWGANANNQTNYFTDGYAWGVVQSIAAVDPCVFLIRANVFTDNKSVQLHPKAPEQISYEKEMSFTKEEAKNIEENIIEYVKMDRKKITTTPTIDNANPFTKAFAAKYSVYRFSEAQKEQESAWTLLTPTNTSDKYYIDNTFNTLAQGSYYYAVKANYTDKLISIPMLSNIIDKDMLTSITLEARTNTTNNEIEGANVRLVNVDGKSEHAYTGVFDADGKLNFPNVWKGEYTLHIAKLGFLNLDTAGILFLTEADYTMNTIVLKQEKRAPYNLKIAPNESQEANYTFTWNESINIEEGFEGHLDFVINSPGKHGWNYKDYDRLKTFSIKGIEYPGQGEPMAYMIFNPTQTEPAIDGVQGLPYKGKKYLASFATSLGQNDDWFISPTLHYTNSFTFSFNAKSFSAADGSERIQVGYSTNSMKANDFVWIQQGSAIAVPSKWTEYNFTIPGQAKYVAIRYISFNTYMLMLDEVFIGNEKQENSPIKGFKVYLDGVEVAQTQTKEYTFTGITNPENHKAGVKAIYESGESEISEIGFIKVDMEEDAFANSLRIYPNPAQNYVFLEGLTQAAVYEIYNMYGSMVKTANVSGVSEQISVSDLSSGSYVIRIISTQGTAIKRFIKK